MRVHMRRANQLLPYCCAGVRGCKSCHNAAYPTSCALRPQQVHSAAHFTGLIAAHALMTLCLDHAASDWQQPKVDRNIAVSSNGHADTHCTRLTCCSLVYIPAPVDQSAIETAENMTASQTDCTVLHHEQSCHAADLLAIVSQLQQQ
jgi:hypothetical protein